MRGAIKLVSEKLAAVPFVHFFHCLCPSYTFLTNEPVHACLCMVHFHRFFFDILLACVLDLAVQYFPLRLALFPDLDRFMLLQFCLDM
jgi:hypothetical protein